MWIKFLLIVGCVELTKHSTITHEMVRFTHPPIDLTPRISLQEFEHARDYPADDVAAVHAANRHITEFAMNWSR